jgi:hypothetical protein
LWLFFLHRGGTFHRGGRDAGRRTGETDILPLRLTIPSPGRPLLFFPPAAPGRGSHWMASLSRAVHSLPSLPLPSPLLCRGRRNPLPPPPPPPRAPILPQRSGSARVVWPSTPWLVDKSDGGPPYIYCVCVCIHIWFINQSAGGPPFKKHLLVGAADAGAAGAGAGSSTAGRKLGSM